MSQDALAVTTNSQLGTGSTIVGIPARNEGRTVGAVARAADTGLTEHFPDGDNLVLLADNGSRDDTIEQFHAAAGNSRQDTIICQAEGTGKGTNVFAIMDQALDLHADRVVLLDADVRSVDPSWVAHLGNAVDGDRPAFAVPLYRRNRFEANTTNHLASPLLSALFGRKIQQPIGGEFAFNRAFLESMRKWRRPQSAQFYGIDIWLTSNALAEDHRVVEVPLGRKIHNSPFPKILSLPQQVVDALFHVILDRCITPSQTPAQEDASRSAVDDIGVPQKPEVIARVTSAVRAYLDEHRPAVDSLFSSAHAMPDAPWGIRVSSVHWPSVLADAVAALGDGEFAATRDHLIALYINRVFTFWDEITGLHAHEIDQLLDRITAETAAELRDRSIQLDRSVAPGRFDPGHWHQYQASATRDSSTASG